MSSQHGRSESHNLLSSPLAQGPTFTPPKAQPHNTSPVRRPLHDRSDSQTNQHSGPTIRIVKDPPNSDDVYQKYPVPSEPSQILPPPRHAPGYGFERPGPRVSSGSQVANTIAKFEASRTLTPQPVLSRKKGFRNSAVSTSPSEEDTLVQSSFSPSSLRFSQGSTAPSSPPPELEDYEKELEVLEEEPPSQTSTIRAVPPSSSSGDSLESRALTPKASAATFASDLPSSPPSLTPKVSAATLDSDLHSSSPPPPIRNAGEPSGIRVARPFPQAYEHSSSSESEAGGSALASDADDRQSVLNPQQSTESFAFSDISYTSIDPIYIYPSPEPEPPIHESRRVSFSTGLEVNYPVVRAPSANSLRAESQNTPIQPLRMQDRGLAHTWSSQLSTIPSVSERDSRSIARNSRSIGTRSHSQESYNGNGRTNIPRRRGQTIGSVQSYSDNSSSSEGYSVVPRPLFSPTSRRSSEERDYNGEHLDTISPLPSSVPLRMKNSGYFHRSSMDATSMSDSRPASAQSNMSGFFQNTIPTWAKVYYQRGERISVTESESNGSVRLGTSHSAREHTPSESNYAPNIYRPRNRPRNRGSHVDTVSLADDMQSIDGGDYDLRPNMSGYSTPHLRPDRRGRPRYGIWKAPSLDDDLHTTLFGRQNRQILLFCLGFLFPPAWILASFLPLPLDPSQALPPSQAELEQQYAQHMGPIDDKAFQKATWWRNLNRVMSAVGTLLIGVIIALAILASRL